MSDTHLDSASFQNPPFQEDFQVEKYFAAANREEILDHALDALKRAASIIILYGDEGSGKTTMCRMIEHQAPSDYSVVVFPRTVDSFEDVIRLVASRLAIDVGATVDRKSVGEYQKKIVNHLVNSGEKLLIIFDEAENIYLATLERIRKVIDLLADAGAKIHVVFSGRPPFLDNCEQLSICDFQYSEEFILQLEPLTREETGEYLRKCVEAIPGIDTNNIFTEKVVADIYSLTDGNFKKINILGEEAIHSPTDNVFLDKLLVNIEADKRKRPENFGILNTLSAMKSHALFPWAGAAVLALFAFLSLYDFSSDETIQLPVISKEKIPQTQPASPSIDIVPPKVVESIDKEDFKEEKEEKLIDPPVLDKSIVNVLDVEKKLVEELEKIAVVAEPAAQITPIEIVDVEQERIIITEEVKDEPNVEPTVPEEIAEIEEPVVVTDVKIAEVEKPVSVKENDLLKSEIPQVPLPAPEKPIAVEKVVIPESKTVLVLRPRENTKKKAEEEEPIQNVHRVTPKKPLIQVQDVVAANAHFTTDQLYQKRLSAGISWRAGRKDDKYTVQLMVLTSKTAEKNLKMMLARDDYREEADNFVVFKNNKEIQTIFVFYGEYSTISQARQAQNSLPQFLRVHKPYAISVKGAIIKVSR